MPMRGEASLVARPFFTPGFRQLNQPQCDRGKRIHCQGTQLWHSTEITCRPSG